MAGSSCSGAEGFILNLVQRVTAVSWIQSLAQELAYGMSVAIKNKQKLNNQNTFFFFFFSLLVAYGSSWARDGI